jgi:uncharacterized membrane protein
LLAGLSKFSSEEWDRSAMIRLRNFDTTYAHEAGASNVYAQSKRGSIARKALGIGVVAGLRSMMPLALLSNINDPDVEDTSAISRLLKSPQFKFASGLAAVGEVIGDKLPVTPSRISPGPLMGRLTIGALAGMEVCRRGDESLIMGAALGASAAALGAFAGYAARTMLSQTTNSPDIVWAGIEDIVALTLGYNIVQSVRVTL